MSTRGWPERQAELPEFRLEGAADVSLKALKHPEAVEWFRSQLAGVMTSKAIVLATRCCRGGETEAAARQM